MSNPSKKKGSAFEVSLLPALRQLDSRVERAAPHGSRDVGDFTTLHVKPPAGELLITVSAKNCKRVALADWIDEVDDQRRLAETDAGIVIHKRPGFVNPEASYVTMKLQTLLTLLT